MDEREMNAQVNDKGVSGVVVPAMPCHAPSSRGVLLLRQDAIAAQAQMPEAEQFGGMAAAKGLTPAGLGHLLRPASARARA